MFRVGPSRRSWERSKRPLSKDIRTIREIREAGAHEAQRRIVYRRNVSGRGAY